MIRLIINRRNRNERTKWRNRVSVEHQLESRISFSLQEFTLLMIAGKSYSIRIKKYLKEIGKEGDTIERFTSYGNLEINFQEFDL